MTAKMFCSLKITLTSEKKPQISQGDCLIVPGFLQNSQKVLQCEANQAITL